MITVFTASHNPKQLERLELSLFKQSYRDFEWVLLLNNSAQYTPEFLPRSKVKVVHDPKTRTIGGYKKKACSHADGSLLVEVDHDDELPSDALYVIANSGITNFGFSNFVELNQLDDGKFNSTVYPEWQKSPFEYYGKLYYSLVAKPCDANNIRYIETAPNHVRVWNTDFYNKLGGHSDRLPICDDYDLVCRSYLNGECKHINRCLYIYHRDGTNTSLQASQQIQRISKELSESYFGPRSL